MQYTHRYTIVRVVYSDEATGVSGREVRDGTSATDSIRTDNSLERAMLFHATPRCEFVLQLEGSANADLATGRRPASIRGSYIVK